VSVLISTVVALTLSPVMCSLVLKPADRWKKKNIVFRHINHWLYIGNKKYIKIIRRVMTVPRRVMAGFGLVLVAIFVINKLMPSSFMPPEDQGNFKIELELPEGSTLERTRQVTKRAMDYLATRDDVAYLLDVTGTSPRVGSNQSRSSEITVVLKPWKERKGSNIKQIADEVKRELRAYPESKVYVTTPPVIPGLGTSGGFEMQLEARGDASYDDLVRATDTLIYYASQRKEITGVYSSMQSEIPQLYFDIDRDKAKILGVPMSDIFSTMKAYTGSVYVNDFNMFNRIYRVYIQAEAPYRVDRDNINLFFVKGAGGTMIPLTSLGTTSYTTGPGTMTRFNMFNTAKIGGEAASGYSSGEAMEIMEQIVREHLPSKI
ncbi:MAG: efflux RND transporter permease subunit, partial [Rikenellaceae bacterium]|nr:efflux RND transporter permease subunit [Rikenellaceae bacterium]